MHRREVTVLFTTPKWTVSALRMARELARDMEAQVRLLVMCEVPFPLPVTRPQVALDFVNGKIGQIASEAAVWPRVELCLCRDAKEKLPQFLAPGSLVVLGGPWRWWGSREQRTARWLQEKGHNVIFAGAPVSHYAVKAQARQAES